jgi:hypothetical protein
MNSAHEAPTLTSSLHTARIPQSGQIQGNPTFQGLICYPTHIRPVSDLYPTDIQPNPGQSGQIRLNPTYEQTRYYILPNPGKSDYPAPSSDHRAKTKLVLRISGNFRHGMFASKVLLGCQPSGHEMSGVGASAARSRPGTPRMRFAILLSPLSCILHGRFPLSENPVERISFMMRHLHE